MRQRIEVAILVCLFAGCVAIAMPAIQQAGEAARRTQCKNNLKQLALGLLNYETEFQAFPLATIGDPARTPEHRWSWYPKLAPFLAQEASPPINYATDPRDPRNWPLTFKARKLEELTITLRAPHGTICPNGARDVGAHRQPFATYVGITGIDPESATMVIPDDRAGIWGYNRCTSADEVGEGQSQTLILMETASDRDVWLYGGRPTARWVSRGDPQIGKGRAFGGLHAGSANAAFADGHVESLSEGLDPLVLARMATLKQAGEPPSE